MKIRFNIQQYLPRKNKAILGTSTWIMVFGISLYMLGVPTCAQAEIYVWEDANGVLHFTDYPKDRRFQSYVGKNRPKPSNWSQSKVVAEIHRISQRHGMDPELIKEVVRAESAFDPLALSHKGAMGLMQLMPQTAKELGVLEPFDPIQNLDGGIRYLRYLLDRFQGKLEWALAAYHAGEGRVQRHSGIPPIASTQSYVKKILSRYLAQ